MWYFTIQSPHTRTCGYFAWYSLSLKCFREKDTHSTTYGMNCLSHYKLVLKLGKFCKLEFYVLLCKRKIMWISCMVPQQIKFWGKFLFSLSTLLIWWNFLFGLKLAILYMEAVSQAEICLCTSIHHKARQCFGLHPCLLTALYIRKIKPAFK